MTKNNNSLSTAVGLSLIITIVVVVIVGGIFYWVQQFKIDQVTDRFLELKQENQSLVENFQQQLDDYKLQIEEQKVIEYSLDDYDYKIIDSGTITQRLVGVNKKNGEIKNFISLKKAFDAGLAIEPVGRINSLYILKLMSADCHDTSIQLWTIDLDKPEIIREIKLGKLGIFNNDLSTYIFGSAPVKVDNIENLRDFWVLMSYNISSGEVKELHQFQVDQSLIEAQSEDDCFPVQIDGKFLPENKIEVNVFQTNKFEKMEFNL